MLPLNLLDNSGECCQANRNENITQNHMNSSIARRPAALFFGSPIICVAKINNRKKKIQAVPKPSVLTLQAIAVTRIHRFHPIFFSEGEEPTEKQDYSADTQNAFFVTSVTEQLVQCQIAKPRSPEPCLRRKSFLGSGFGPQILALPPLTRDVNFCCLVRVSVP